MRDPETGVVTVESRAWNSKSDATELVSRISEWRSMKNKFINQRGQIWAYLTRSISREIRTRLDLDPAYKEMQMAVNTFDLFEMLRKHSTEIATSNAQALGNNWRNLRFPPGSSIRQFLVEFDDAVNKLIHAKQAPKPSDITYQLGIALKNESSYQHVMGDVYKLDVTDTNYPEYERLKEQLCRFADSNKSANDDLHQSGSSSRSKAAHNGDNTKAYLNVAKQGDLRPRVDEGTKRTSDRNGRHFDDKGARRITGREGKGQDEAEARCQNCDTRGHFSRNCTASKIICNHCHRAGHMEKFCKDKKALSNKSTEERHRNDGHYKRSRENSSKMIGSDNSRTKYRSGKDSRDREDNSRRKRFNRGRSQNSDADTSQSEDSRGHGRGNRAYAVRSSHQDKHTETETELLSKRRVVTAAKQLANAKRQLAEAEERVSQMTAHTKSDRMERAHSRRNRRSLSPPECPRTPPEEGFGSIDLAMGEESSADEESTNSSPGARSHMLIAAANEQGIKAKPRANVCNTTSTTSDLLVDSGSTYHVEPTVQPVVLHAKTNCNDQVSVAGIDGNPMEVSHTGTVPTLGKFYVVPGAEVPLVSVGELCNTGHKLVFEGKSVVITHRNKPTVQGHINDNNHFVLDRSTWSDMQSTVPNYDNNHTEHNDASRSNRSYRGAVDTMFTSEQRRRAEQVRLLHNTHAHLSDKTLINALTFGTITGTSLTAKDVITAREILGPCTSCIAGKTTKPSYKPSENEPAIKVGDVVHVDIYILFDTTIGGYVYYVISVDEYSGYLNLIPLKSKSSEHLCIAFEALLAAYKRFNHVIKSIQCDHESSIIATNNYLGDKNVILKATPPYQHAQRIERYVRTVNDRMRTILASLPYVLDTKLYGELLIAIIGYLNDFPTSLHHKQSPRLLVENTRLNLNQRKLVPFGTVAMLHKAGKQMNKVEPRAEMGIILGPALLTYSAVRAYLFDSQRVVTRSAYTELHRIPEPFPWPVTQVVAPVTDILIPSNGAERKRKRDYNDSITNFELNAYHGHKNKLENRPKPYELKSGIWSSKIIHKKQAKSEKISNIPRSIKSVKHVHYSDQEATTSAITNVIMSSNEGRQETTLKTISKPARTSEAITQASHPSMIVGNSYPNDTLIDQLDSDLHDSSKAPTSREVMENVITTSYSYGEGDSGEKPMTASREKSNHSSREGELIELTPQQRDSSQTRNKRENTLLSKRDKLAHAAYKPLQQNPIRRSPSTQDVHTSSKTIDRSDNIRHSGRTALRTWKDGPPRMRAMLATSYKVSVKEALAGSHAQESKEAILDEINNMLTYKVGHYTHFKDVPKHLRRNILYSFMFLKHKEKPDGTYERTKARMVGNGANQKEHMYDLISSSTIALATVFLLFNIASYYRATLSSYDIKGAFLHAKFEASDEVTYIKINRQIAKLWVELDPEAAPYLDEKGELLLQLDKFIYGLKQSPYKFQQHLIKVLIKLGYVQQLHDECLFIKIIIAGWSIISTHVDDILQTANLQSLVKELHQALIDEYGSVTFHEKADAYIGMTVYRSNDLRTISLTQRGLTDKILKKYLPAGSERRTAKTPAADEIFETSNNKDQSVVNRKDFLGLIMSLMYLARLTRPDLLLPVTYLASKSHCATTEDLKKAERILYYLVYTRDLGITIRCEGLQLKCLCDASYGVHDDGRSHTGYIITLGETRSYLHARSGKQKLTATSSTDAEVIAMVESLKMCVWMRNVIQYLNISPLRTIVLYQDNKSAIIMIEEPSKYKRSRHILTKIGYARDLCRLGIVRVKYLNTNDMTADVLTKSKQGSIYVIHRNNMMGMN